jgi:DNA-directed RNA polymerase specialized sigma24 family protein
MLELLERGVDREEGDAWGELFQIFDNSAAPAVRRIAKACGFSAIDPEDAVLDVVDSLYADDARRLRTFNGSMPQLRRWLRVVATRHVRKWVRCERRRRRREEAALTLCSRGTSETPLTEQDIKLLLAEFATVASPEDYDKVQFFLGRKLFDPPPSRRTQQRWAKDLIEKYPDFFRSGRF